MKPLLPCKEMLSGRCCYAVSFPSFFLFFLSFFLFLSFILSFFLSFFFLFFLLSSFFPSSPFSPFFFFFIFPFFYMFQLIMIFLNWTSFSNNTKRVDYFCLLNNTYAHLFNQNYMINVIYFVSSKCEILLPEQNSLGLQPHPDNSFSMKFQLSKFEEIYHCWPFTREMFNIIYCAPGVFFFSYIHFTQQKTFVGSHIQYAKFSMATLYLASFVASQAVCHSSSLTINPKLLC